MRTLLVITSAVLLFSCAGHSPIPGEKDRCFFMAAEVPTWLLLRANRTFSVYVERGVSQIDDYCHGSWKPFTDNLLVLTQPTWFRHIEGRIDVDPGGEEWTTRLAATREALVKLMKDR